MDFLQSLSFRLRVSFAVCGGLITFFLLPSTLHLPTRLLATWTITVYYFLFPIVLMLINTDAETTSYRARRFNLRRSLLFSVVAIAIAISFIAFHLLRASKEASTQVITLNLSVAMSAIVISWFLLHTLFAQQYAALYYRSDPPGGIQFPGQDTPTDWDFLYLSFVFGATAQAADSFILSRSIRRLALGHCLISFWYFVGIVGMAVNLVSELL